MNLGTRIKLRREELNMSQNELAIKLGYKSRSTINKIELGINDVTQHKIAAFAEALQTTPAYLMGWEDEKGNSLIGSKKNIDPISQLSKKEKFEYDKFMEDAIYFFNDETVSDEDKKKLFDGLQTAFFTILLKKENKKKNKK